MNGEVWTAMAQHDGQYAERGICCVDALVGERGEERR